MIYTVTLNPAIDYTVRLKAFRPGATNRAADETYTIGGKGVNVSLMLSRLGIPSAALGFVAGFTGSEIERGLQKESIQTDFIHLANGFTRINLKIRGETESEINGAGPAVDRTALEALFQKLEVLKPGDILVLAGKPPASLPQDVYAQILKTIADRSVRTAVDTVDHFLLETLPYRPFLIKPNRQELADLFGMDTVDDEHLEFYTGELQKQGAQNILVSLGKEGAFLLDERGVSHRVPTVRGKVIGTVGAGDSMVAGFLTGFLQTGDYEQALRLGNACGMATAFSDGIGDADAIRHCWDLQETLIQKH